MPCKRQWGRSQFAVCVCLLLAARSVSGQAHQGLNDTAANSGRSSNADTEDPRGATPLSEFARGYKKMAQTILPLLVGFKATGLLVMAMAITKAILLKALFLSTTALAIAALVALKKFLTSAGAPHDRGAAAYTFQHHDLSHVPYLHPEYMASEHQPQVTYIGGSYGLHAMPYSAGLQADDVQGLYSSQSVVPAALPAAQLQQLQEQQQALLAQQLHLHHLQVANQTHGHETQLSRRRLSALQETTEASPYPYRLAKPA